MGLGLSDLRSRDGDNIGYLDIEQIGDAFLAVRLHAADLSELCSIFANDASLVAYPVLMAFVYFSNLRYCLRDYGRLVKQKMQQGFDVGKHLIKATQSKRYRQLTPEMLQALLYGVGCLLTTTSAVVLTARYCDDQGQLDVLKLHEAVRNPDDCSPRLFSPSQGERFWRTEQRLPEIGSASCRERVCRYV